MMQSLPEGDLKALVGHSQSMDTWGVYCHEMDGDYRRVAMKVDAIVDNLLSNKIG